MAFKVFIGRKEKGGSTAQQADQFLSAALDLEDQLNDKGNGVLGIETAFLNMDNASHAEIIAIATVNEKPVRKEK